MRTVEARRRRPEPSSVCLSSSRSEVSVGGVEGDCESESVISVSWDESEALPKLVVVTDRERTRGSSGTGLSGCEVDETGTFPDSPRWVYVGLEAAVRGDSAVWGTTACTEVDVSH
jgi:hypothetical protein